MPIVVPDDANSHSLDSVKGYLPPASAKLEGVLDADNKVDNLVDYLKTRSPKPFLQIYDKEEYSNGNTEVGSVFLENGNLMITIRGETIPVKEYIRDGKALIVPEALDNVELCQLLRDDLRAQAAVVMNFQSYIPLLIGHATVADILLDKSEPMVKLGGKIENFDPTDPPKKIVYEGSDILSLTTGELIVQVTNPEFQLHDKNVIAGNTDEPAVLYKNSNASVYLYVALDGVVISVGVR